MQTISEDVRKTAAAAWLDTFKDRYGLAPETLEPASSDAGFRRYFRVTGSASKTFIVMDAPTDKMNSEPFVRIDGLMKAAGLNVPEIYEQNLGEGFLLLSDLGRQTYLDVLNEDNAARLFDLATTELVKWQQATRPGVLPEYDHALLERELKLFPEWYVSRHKGFKMTEKQQALVNVVFERIMANNLAEAKVFVHRDFMPRNLMVTRPVGRKFPCRVISESIGATSNGWGCSATSRFWGFLPGLITATESPSTSPTRRALSTTCVRPRTATMN